MTGPSVADRGLTEALVALRAGLIVGVPTDTVYGIGADPFCEAAVASLFAAKGRPGVKPIPLLVASLGQARRLGVFERPAAEAAQRHWPGALTLVVPRAPSLPSWIGDLERGSVGLRVPDHPVALALLEAFGPLAVTSANRSGQRPPANEAQARAMLGSLIAVYLPGSGVAGAASTVVDFTGEEPMLLRRGALEWGRGHAEGP